MIHRARIRIGEGPKMTVLIYVKTSKHVGDPDHLKVFADAAETWFEENGPRRSI